MKIKILKRAKFIFVVLAILLLQEYLFSQQYWIQQPCPTTKLLTRLVFADSLHGWAVGDSGVIIHTSNGGQDWVIQQSGINDPIEDVFFTDNLTGWGITNNYSIHGTTILRTTNGGMNWSNSVFSDTTFIIRSVLFIDSLNGFLGGQNGFTANTQIMKTTNGGINWKPCFVSHSICYGFPVLRLKFFNAATGFACGGLIDHGGIFLMTTDGGSNWSDTCLSAEPLLDSRQVSNNRIVSIGGDPEYGAVVFQTTTGGLSWQSDYLGIGGGGTRLANRTASEYWIPCGISGKFAVSLDSAKTWFGVNAPDSCYVYDTHFNSQYNGWSIGCKGSNICQGIILKYNTDVIGVEPKSQDIPVNYVLYQNYPNPFNPLTTIRFDLPDLGQRHAIDLQLKVYDILGNEVWSYRDFKTAGSYSVDFDGTNLASGVYFFGIETQDFSRYKKMILIK